MTKFFRPSKDILNQKHLGYLSYAITGDVQKNEFDEDVIPYGRVGVGVSRDRFLYPHKTGPVDFQSFYGHQHQILANHLGLHPDYVWRKLKTESEELSPEDVDDYDYDGLGFGPYSNAMREITDSHDEQPLSHAATRRVNEKLPNTLFEMSPGEVTVESAFTHSGLRHSLPTLFSVIQNDFPEKTIVASGDLSPHSSKLARHAAKLGLAKPPSQNPRMQVTNYHDFDDEDYVVAPEDVKDVFSLYQEVPKQEVSLARSSLRQKLREAKGKTSRGGSSDVSPRLSNQFDQPRLPGLEDF